LNRDKGNEAQDTGNSEADKAVGNDRTDVKHRAMRHCIASAVLAQLLRDCHCADCAGARREIYQNDCQKQPKREGDRGIFNNAAGRECVGCGGVRSGFGRPSKNLTVAEIVECCKGKLDDGKLDIGAGPAPKLELD
jgi:hypothetical protein